MTRGNAVWRVPLMIDGGVSKVGLAIQLSGGLGGPDGMALDAEGGLVVAHIGLGVWRFDALGRPTHFIDPPGRFVTNIAFKGTQLYMTEIGDRHDPRRRHALSRQADVRPGMYATSAELMP